MLGWIVDLDRPVVIVAGDDQDRAEIVRQCLDIGHDALVGELDGGVDAWRASGRRITGIPLVAPDDMVGTVIDVRLRSEFDNGHVPGALNIELGALRPADVPDGPITVMCGHGERAMTGASLLAARGHRGRQRARRRARRVGRLPWRVTDGRVMTASAAPTAAPIRLGLRENIAQFSLLVGVNALVGGMIGQERTVLRSSPRRSSASPSSPPRSRSSPPSGSSRRGRTSSPAPCPTGTGASRCSSPDG